jgi:ubiquinone/menaquinone biosynthesis C-methylase UbiE
VVVSTLVVCTVQDLALALSEIARVLRPGGRLMMGSAVA